MASGMKVLLIGNYRLDRQYSMLRFAELIRNGLSERGIEHELITPRPFFGKLPMSPFPTRKWLRYIDKYCLFPLPLRRKISALGKEPGSPPAIVHICDHSNAVYIGLTKGVPHLVTCHDMMAIRSALGHFPRNPTHWSGRILQKRILRGLRMASHIACVSENTRRDLLSLINDYPSGFPRVIHNDLNSKYAKLGIREARKRLSHLQLPPEARVLLHVGSNSWYKNRWGVLRIFKKVRQKLPSVPLFLVVAGAPFERRQEDWVGKENLTAWVRMAGRVKGEELEALYSLADVFLFPSFYEGFGWPPLEAQACGCPVVASCNGALPEVLEESALTAPAEEEDALAGSVIRLLTDDALRTEIMKRGYANCARFQAGRMVERYIDAYREILTARE